jgi:hypothetical protein
MKEGYKSAKKADMNRMNKPHANALAKQVKRPLSTASAQPDVTSSAPISPSNNQQEEQQQQQQYSSGGGGNTGSGTALPPVSTNTTVSVDSVLFVNYCSILPVECRELLG